MRLGLLPSGLVCCLGVQAAGIKISSDPALPTPNLVQNPDLEQGADGKPLGWSFITATPDNFQTGWQEGGRSGKCLWAKALSGKMSGYWNTTVAVEAGRTYFLQGYYRLGGGRILCYVHSTITGPDGKQVSVDERFYRSSLRGHWLSPVFLPPDCLSGPAPEQWQPLSLKVPVPAGPAVKAVAISLGIYFTPGEAWFDDIWFGRAETDLQVSVAPAPGEALKRVIVRKVGSEKPVFDRALADATTPFSTQIANQPADAEYEVEVTLADGRVVRQRYPERTTGPPEEGR